MMGLWALVKPFILFTFGAQWQPSIPLLIILVPVGIVQSLGTTVGIIYQARGRTDLMFKWILGAGPLIILSFFVGLRWGILGVASSYAVISLILAYPNFAIPFKLINLSMSDFWQSIWKPLQSSLVMLAALCILKTAMPDNMPAGMVLLLLVPIGALIYLSTSWFTNRAQLIDIWTAIKAKA
jgi:O-antigen/teichoic acid export membrane protein